MTTNNTAAAAAARKPHIDTAQVQDQVEGLLASSALWLRTHWLQILIGIGAGVAIAAALFWLRGLGPRLVARSRTGKGWSAVLGRAVERTHGFFIVLLSAKLVVGYAGAPVDVSSTVTFLFTVAAVFQAAIWARELILGAIEHRTRNERLGGEALGSALGLIRLLVSFAVFAIAFVVVLDNLGVNVTGLVAGLGVGGIAIGLAAQGIFADLFAALAIIFDRPFRRGDAVTYDSTSGTVEEIGLKSTRIRGIDGELRVISNKNLLDKEIQNNTVRERRRSKFIIGLAYETPTDQLERFPDTMKEVIEACGMTYVRCGFFQFGTSSLDFDVQFDSPSADFTESFNGRHRTGIAILKRCNEEGLTIAYPMQVNYTAAPDGRLIDPRRISDDRGPRDDA
ncbi:mechanosensitive ion channel [Sphingomonas sp. HHU CXW]|uniref:Small-conductance mechanosensitive channel n=1 Tax=Sphingomonas hominis TaxID=2741495 RepID=A0ABX2JED1_9SPHN|nr:mechanosensitive ion channel family protein [Sphingomonas hominis]NTS64833.1 mechanosensitive ion channel [Sphingomonas hominis]